jgi:hypothetical protein
MVRFHDTVSLCALVVTHDALVSVTLFDKPSPTAESRILAIEDVTVSALTKAHSLTSCKRENIAFIRNAQLLTMFWG